MKLYTAVGAWKIHFIFFLLASISVSYTHLIRYKSKKNEKKHIGNRQPYTKLQIVSIAL